MNGTEGVSFAVWAPNASRVSVVGDFNGWDGNQHALKALPSGGLWEIFIPLLPQGTLYKFEIHNSHGSLLPLKHDPYAMYFEQPPGNASITFKSKFAWTDANYIKSQSNCDPIGSAISIYEVHPLSWRRRANNQPLSYRDLSLIHI